MEKHEEIRMVVYISLMMIVVYVSLRMIVMYVSLMMMACCTYRSGGEGRRRPDGDVCSWVPGAPDDDQVRWWLHL